MRKPDLGAQGVPDPSTRRTPQGRQASPAAGPGAVALGRLRSFRVSGLTFVVLGMLVLLVVIVAPGLRVFIEQRQQIAQYQQAVEGQKAQNSGLDADIARWSDPAYIKAQARDRLYYVMPGETSFLIIDDAPPTAGGDTAPVTSSLQATKVDWLSALFGSGMSAGLSTKTLDELQKSGSVQ